MPSPDVIPGTACEWLARARGDLALARVPLPDGAFLDDLCFHAQQAAEKAIKAVYRDRGWPFRYVHDIEAVLTGLKQRGVAIPPEIEESVILTGYATTGRYPSREEPVTPEEHATAIALAGRVVVRATAITAPAPK
jgi:HEPN domain-containing protein